jgi:hypothetical protein
MSQLEEDLQKDYEEMRKAFNAKDIITGLMILAGMTAELAALIAVVIGFINIMGIISGGLGYLGIPISAGVFSVAIRRAVPEIIRQYSNMSKEKRKAFKMALVFLGVSPNIFDI